MTTLAIFESVAYLTPGVAATSADVEVRVESTGALAAIWSDEAGTATIANPATAFTDPTDGSFKFYAAGSDRGYSIKVTKGAATKTFHNVAIGTAGQLDQAALVLKSQFAGKGSQAVATGAGVVVDKALPASGYGRVSNPSASDGWTDVPFMSKNMLINPNWQIDQINEGALYTVNTTGVFGPDGWSGDAVGTGVFKLRTVADPDNAALKCLEISCTTADASIAATDRYEVWTAVEGYDAAALQLGTASAQPFTYQFGLKSNAVTGVFGVYFTNSAGNRFYAGTITVPDTAAHEYTVPITGDLAGTWLYTNGIGLRMGLVLAAGSNFQGAAGSWSASTIRTTGSQANFMSVNTNILYLKRNQLITGASPQAYAPADLQKELAKAQRQFYKTFQQGTAVAQAIGVNTGEATVFQASAAGSAVQLTHYFPEMRITSPAVTTFNPGASNAQVRNETDVSDDSATSVAFSNTHNVLINFTSDGGSAPGHRHGVHLTVNARLS